MKHEYFSDDTSVYFLSYSLNDQRITDEQIKQHALVYVQSGKLIVEGKGKVYEIGTGEYVFLRGYNFLRMNATVNEQTKNYQVYSIEFPRLYLRNFFHSNIGHRENTHKENSDDIVKIIPHETAIESLFMSIIPYFEQNKKPSDEIFDLKVKEGILALLKSDSVFYKWFFDFREPWKMDIKEYMEETYLENASLMEHAQNTGRSLAAFKRDFKVVSDLPPGKWIVDKRLQEAYRLIKYQNKKPVDIYLNLGFKSLSHFSSAFKNKFGYSPRSVD